MSVVLAKEKVFNVKNMALCALCVIKEGNGRNNLDDKYWTCPELCLRMIHWAVRKQSVFVNHIFG